MSCDVTTHLLRTACYPWAGSLGLAVINVHIKFKVSMFTN